jgi:hypothetical protein
MRAKKFMRDHRTITAEEFNRLAKPKKKSKFKNKRTEVDGVKFDSKKEAARWQQLKLMEDAGLVKDLKRQVRFALEVKEQLIGYYVADFTYLDASGFVVEDVKSDFTRKNPVYILKKKLMKAIHDIEIREV